MRLRPVALPALLSLFLASSGVAQARDTARAPGATITGVVYDSIADSPLAGAIVQLAGTDSLSPFGRTTTSDSEGRFRIVDVPAGRYTLGFFHAMLDSIGLDPTLRAIEVRGREVRANLAIPSPARIRAAICAPFAAADSGGIVIGIVRDVRDLTPIANASVTAAWLELTFRAGAIESRVPHIVATTGENGWFALCNVPSSGIMMLAASRGEDSTDLIDVNVPGEGFLRFDLYLGPARTLVLGDSAQPVDSATRPAHRLVGDGRLRGSVRTSASEWERGRPLSDARVSLAGSVETRANELGEWTLADAPLGTRMLEVRALGYFPERRPVHVLPGAGAPPVRISLSTMKAMLDTIRVTARRAYDPRFAGFENRRRSGMGRYITPDHAALRAAVFASDVFRMVPSMYVEGSRGAMDRPVTMRGAFGRCTPALYIDGMHIPSASGGLTADDIDMWVRPEDIIGVEVYTSIVPSEFQWPMSQCGSIVIWTSPPLGPRSRLSFKQRLVRVSIFTAIGMGIGALISR